MKVDIPVELRQNPQALINYLKLQPSLSHCELTIKSKAGCGAAVCSVKGYIAAEIEYDPTLALVGVHADYERGVVCISNGISTDD